MSTTSLRAAVRAELVRRLKLDGAFDGVRCDYAVPRGGLEEAKHVFFGGTDGNIDYPLAHPTRLPRNDDFTMDLFIYVSVLGDDTGEESDAQVLDLYAAVDNLLASSHDLGQIVPGVLSCAIGSLDGPTPLPTDQGYESRIKARIEVSTRLQ
jgi:hypothetical protein